MATKIIKKSNNPRGFSELLPKNISSRLNKQYFPKFSRFITERKVIFWGISLVLLLCGVVISILLLSRTMQEYQAETKNREVAQEQLSYWEGIIKKHPDYRDAYVVAAGLAYEVRDSEKALHYLSQAQKLDPNNQTLEKMSQKVKK